MKRFICAFSSDYRPLYRADIYKVLSMPNKFVIHFRYKLEYVEENIINNIKSYVNKTVIIFYTPNNKLDNIPDNISVRKAKLINAEVVENTKLFHAYMQLDDFCDISINDTVPSELLPSNKFFSELECNVNVLPEKWVNKINYLKPYFPDHSFYNIKSLKTVFGKTKKVKVTNDKKGCYYCLNHGSKYLAELSVANPNETNCKLTFLSSSDDISANMQNPIEITAHFDDITVPIYLKSLNVSTESSFISFIPKNKKKINSEYTTNIEIEKKIGFGRAFSFGIYTLFAVLSIWIIKDNSESISNIGKWAWSINWKAILASITLLVSSSLLFSQFNKK